MQDLTLALSLLFKFAAPFLMVQVDLCRQLQAAISWKRSLMRYPNALACALLGLITVGCNNKDSKPLQTKESRLVQSKDPVQGLQEFNEKLTGELNASTPVISAPDGSSDQWYKRQVFTSGQMSYNVTKTDSLVSPFVGKVEFNCNFHVSKSPSAQAITTAPFTDAFKDKCVLMS